MKDADQIARRIAPCWQLQVKNCLCPTCVLVPLIAIALREMYQQGQDDGSDAKFEATIKAADAEGYRRGYEEGSEFQMKMRVRDQIERGTGGGE